MLYPRLQIAGTDTVTHRATSNVGSPAIRNGALVTDNHDDFLGSVTLAQKNVDPVTGCRPSPSLMSWVFDIVEIPIEYSYYNNISQIDCASGRVTVEHKFMPMLTLTLGSQGEQGYAVADPAKKYYAEPFEANPVYEQVTITARPLPGFEFTHWSGDGVCYPNGMSQPAVVLEGCQNTTITIEMYNDRAVVPKFEEDPANPCPCSLILGVFEGGFEFPKLITDSADQIEALLGPWFDGFHLELGGEYKTSPTSTCSRGDGTTDDANKREASVTLDVTTGRRAWPGFGFTETINIGFGRYGSVNVSISAGLTGQAKISLSGEYVGLDFECNCLLAEYCRGDQSLSLKGSIIPELDIGLAVSLSAFGVQVDPCTVSFVNAIIPGTVSAGLVCTPPDCVPSTCLGATFGPVTISGHASAWGICAGYSFSYPKNGPWEIGYPCP